MNYGKIVIRIICNLRKKFLNRNAQNVAATPKFLEVVDILYWNHHKSESMHICVAMGCLQPMGGGSTENAVNGDSLADELCVVIAVVGLSTEGPCVCSGGSMDGRGIRSSYGLNCWTKSFRLIKYEDSVA